MSDLTLMNTQNSADDNLGSSSRAWLCVIIIRRESRITDSSLLPEQFLASKQGIPTISVDWTPDLDWRFQRRRLLSSGF